MKKSHIILGIAILISIFIIINIINNEELNRYSTSFFAMGTYNEIIVLSNSEEEANKTFELIINRINELEKTVSYTKEESEVTKLNSGEKINLSHDTNYLIENSFEYFNKTNGVFNVGMGSVINLWEIAHEKEVPPHTSDINYLMNYTDMNEFLILENNKGSIIDNNFNIHLGGIAKGYAVDESKSIIIESDIENAIINFGGDLYVLGTNKLNESYWNIGIQSPIIGENKAIASVEVKDRSIVSSGTYERFFIYDENLYHHIIDPITGFPTTNNLTSVSILTSNAMDADVYSTSVLIMGLEEGIDFIIENNLEGILIDDEKNIYISESIYSEFKLLDDSFNIIKF